MYFINENKIYKKKSDLREWGKLIDSLFGSL